MTELYLELSANHYFNTPRPTTYIRCSGKLLNPSKAHNRRLETETARRFLRVWTPISSHFPLACVRLTSSRVGAIKHCMPVLLAASKTELITLINRWDHTPIFLVVEQVPEYKIVMPSWATWLWSFVYTNTAILMQNTTVAVAQPNLMLTFHFWTAVDDGKDWLPSASRVSSSRGIMANFDIFGEATLLFLCHPYVIYIPSVDKLCEDNRVMIYYVRQLYDLRGAETSKLNFRFPESSHFKASTAL